MQVIASSILSDKRDCERVILSLFLPQTENLGGNLAVVTEKLGVNLAVWVD